MNLYDYFLRITLTNCLNELLTEVLHVDPILFCENATHNSTESLLFRFWDLIPHRVLQFCQSGIWSNVSHVYILRKSHQFMILPMASLRTPDRSLDFQGIAVVLNGIGVSLLEAGYVDKADKAFSAALHSMKTSVLMLRGEIPNHYNDTDHEEVIANTIENAKYLLSEKLNRTRLHATRFFGRTEPIGTNVAIERNRPHKHLTKPKVYLTPMRIDRAKEENVGKRESAVILFNSALAHHIRSFATDNMEGKALGLYHLLETLIFDSPNNSSSNETPDALLLQAALLNNIGCIYYNGQRVVSKLYFARLASLIDETKANEKIWTEFILNVLYSLASASPAA